MLSTEQPCKEISLFGHVETDGAGQEEDWLYNSPVALFALRTKVRGLAMRRWNTDEIYATFGI